MKSQEKGVANYCPKLVIHHSFTPVEFNNFSLFMLIFNCVFQRSTFIFASSNVTKGCYAFQATDGTVSSNPTKCGLLSFFMPPLKYYVHDQRKKYFLKPS